MYEFQESLYCSEVLIKYVSVYVRELYFHSRYKNSNVRYISHELRDLGFSNVPSVSTNPSSRVGTLIESIKRPLFNPNHLEESKKDIVESHLSLLKYVKGQRVFLHLNSKSLYSLCTLVTEFNTLQNVLLHYYHVKDSSSVL